MLGPEAGLTGANVNEHDKMWDPHQRESFRAEHPDFFVNFAMEVSTDLGHMIAVGLPAYIAGIRRAERLREALDEVGGFLIVAHPFPPRLRRRHGDARRRGAVRAGRRSKRRSCRSSSSSTRSKSRTGATRRARTTSRSRSPASAGLPGTGGSDAHSESGIGYFATGFEQAVTGEVELLAELRSGRFEAVLRAPDGGFVRFEPGCVEAVAAARP